MAPDAAFADSAINPPDQGRGGIVEALTGSSTGAD